MNLLSSPWASWAEFVHMGGYGGFVWGSYGLTLLVLLAEAWAVRQRLRRIRQALRDEQLAQDENHNTDLQETRP